MHSVIVAAFVSFGDYEKAAAVAVAVEADAQNNDLVEVRGHGVSAVVEESGPWRSRHSACTSGQGAKRRLEDGGVATEDHYWGLRELHLLEVFHQMGRSMGSPE